MTDPTRRALLRALGLAPLTLAACKIEPILELGSSPDELDPQFPHPPPKIPDQLEDAEATLRALADELLAVEIPRFSQGDLRDRSVDDTLPIHHLRDLLASFGLQPAGPRGAWRQAVALQAVEPTGAQARVVLRAEAIHTDLELRHPPNIDAASTDPADTGPSEDPVEPGRGEGPTPGPSAPANPSASLDPEGSSDLEGPPDGAAPPSSPSSPTTDPGLPSVEPLPPPAPVIDLARHGAFRQPGSPSVVLGLLTSATIEDHPSFHTSVVGRVVWVRTPPKFDLLSEAAQNLIETWFVAAEHASAMGCILLTSDPGPGIEAYRQRWASELRRSEDAPSEALELVGLLDAEGSAMVAAALEADSAQVLDIDLATQQRNIVSHNLLARMVGRERPDEAVVLTCTWDLPNPADRQRDTHRLLTTLATVAQLASWQRRSTRSSRSLLVVFTVDGGIGAGQLEHARWAATQGARPTAILSLDQPSRPVPDPAVLVSGHLGEASAAVARRVIEAEGREMLRSDTLSMPHLGAYLRYQHPVMTLGEAPAELTHAHAAVPEPESESESGEDPEAGGAEPTPGSRQDGALSDTHLDGLHADVRLLRNLTLALAAQPIED